MTDLISLAQNTSTSTVVNSFLKIRKYFSFYKNGKKVFVLIFNNRVIVVSEFILAFTISTATFISVLLIKDFIRKYKNKKKLKKLLFQQTRSGGEILEIDYILAHEQLLELDDQQINLFNPLSQAFFI